MDKKEVIRITTRKEGDLSTKLSHKGKEYYIMTDTAGRPASIIKTLVYHKGQIIKTITKELKTFTQLSVTEEMTRQHQKVLERIKKNLLFFSDLKSTLRELSRLVANGKYDEAEEYARYALEEFPDEPVLSSFYGYLIARQKSNIQDGLLWCQEALKRALRAHLPEINLALIYLNLGRVHLLNNDRRSAIRAFKTGLGYDPDNKEINRELVSLGVRKPPVIPFLPRSHPINKYLGKLRHRWIQRKKN